jgi:hypothetical protein
MNAWHDHGALTSSLSSTQSQWEAVTLPLPTSTRASDSASLQAASFVVAEPSACASLARAAPAHAKTAAKLAAIRVGRQTRFIERSFDAKGSRFLENARDFAKNRHPLFRRALWRAE